MTGHLTYRDRKSAFKKSPDTKSYHTVREKSTKIVYHYLYLSYINLTSTIMFLAIGVILPDFVMFYFTDAYIRRDEENTK